MKTWLVLAGLLMATGPADTKQQPPIPCAGGRFTIAGTALMGGTATDDLIVIRRTRLAVKSGCGPADIKVTSAGSELRASWRSCLAARGAVHLRARFDGSCGTLSGEVATRGRRRVTFTASREDS